MERQATLEEEEKRSFRNFTIFESGIGQYLSKSTFVVITYCIVLYTACAFAYQDTQVRYLAGIVLNNVLGREKK